MIFKLAQEEGSISATGEHAAPEIGLSQAFKDKYLELGKKHSTTYPNMPPKDNDEPENSFIIDGSGNIIRIHNGIWHGNFMHYVNNDFQQKDPVLWEKNKHALDNAGYTYEKIHHVYSGGLRVWALKNSLYITIYQVPNDAQMRSLKQFLSEYDGRKMYVDGAIYPNGEYKSLDYTGTSGSAAASYINSFKSQKTQSEPSQEDLARIEKIREFRSPFYGQVPAIETPQRQTHNWSPEELRSLFKQFPRPNRQRYYSADSIHNLIKFAESLDKRNEFQVSDCVIEYLEQLLR